MLTQVDIQQQPARSPLLCDKLIHLKTPTFPLTFLFTFSLIPPILFSLIFSLSGQIVFASTAHAQNNHPAPKADSTTASRPTVDARISSICEVDDFAGARQRTTVLGQGMGNESYSVASATLPVPLVDNVLALHAQMTGKRRDALPKAVTIESDQDRVVMDRYTTLGTDPNFALYTYETAMTPAESIRYSVDDTVLDGYHTPRGAVLYATYSRQSLYFEEVRQINTFVYYSRGKPAHTESVAIPPLSEPRDIIASLVIVDNGRDNRRSFYYTVAAGGVEQVIESDTPRQGEELDIFYVRLEDVPIGTSEVTITVESSPGGESVEWAGYSVGFECTRDSDGDGVPDVIEDMNGDGDPTNDDSDGDGAADFLDLDDDGDGIDTADEDANNDFDPTNDDSDGNGTADYIEGAVITPVEPPLEPSQMGADLSVTQSLISANGAVAGAPIEYKIVVQNSGPLTATEVVMLNQLAAGVRFQSAQIVSDADEIDRSFQNNDACEQIEDSGAEVRCELGEMAAGAHVQILVTGLVDAAVAAGTILENGVSVLGTSNDPDAANNRASLETAVTTVASLTIEYAVSNSAPAAGEEIVYSARVRNGGPSVAGAVSVQITLPEEMRFVESNLACLVENIAEREYVCTIGELNADEAVSVEVTTAITDTPACDGLLRDSFARAQANNAPEQVSASAGVVIACPADLQVRQFSSSVDQLVAGEAVTLTLQVENLGPGIASGVVVTGEIKTGGLFDVIAVNPDVYAEREEAVCAMIEPFNIQLQYEIFECYLNGKFEAAAADGSGRWGVEVVVFGLEDQALALSAGTFAQTTDPDLSNNWTDEVALPESTNTAVQTESEVVPETAADLPDDSADDTLSHADIQDQDADEMSEESGGSDLHFATVIRVHLPMFDLSSAVLP